MSMLGDMDSASKALNNPEVLVCIVKYLPSSRDVINFRRVCKLWNENCDPKFVFRQFDLKPQEIDALVRKAGCRRLNLEFQDCDLRFISDEMWKIWNPKLRSLRIHGCITKIESLQSIISNCVGLEVLEIVLKRYIYGNLLEKLLDYFIEREARHTRLRRLLINGQQFMTMSHFLKLLTVFPCIVYLSCDVGKADDDGRYLCWVSYGTYDLRKLKSYTVVSKNDDHWLERPVAPMRDYQLFRLTTYKTVFQFTILFADIQRRERLFNFFNIQKDLEVIDFQIYGISDDNFGESIKSLMFHVLRTCSKLREFYIRDYDARDPRMIARFGFIKLTSKEFKEFFSLMSSLQCFKLTYLLKKDISKTTVLPLSVPKTSLNVLRLNTREPYFSSGLKLISSKLKHLNIDVYSDQQLREIIVTLPNLEVLILRLRGCTNYGFTGKNEESSIRRLRKLEYLYIFDSKGRITNKVFNEFRFPRLDYLGLKLKHGNQLPETLLNMPTIQTLEILLMDRNFYLMPEFISKLCKFLGNLKHLVVDKLAFERDLSDKKKLKIFNLLSNLRFITCYRNQDTFMFDRLSGKASSIDEAKLQFCEDKFYSQWDRDYDR